MDNVKKKIKELITICKSATSGPYHIGHINENFPDLMDVDNYEGICIAEDIEEKNANYFSRLNPAIVSKLLESWLELRIALETVSQYIAFDGDGMFTEAQKLAAFEAIAKADEVFK